MVDQNYPIFDQLKAVTLAPDEPRIRPLGPRVLVRRLELPELTKSGLFLMGREYPAQGIVVAVGPGWRVRRAKRVGVDPVLRVCSCGNGPLDDSETLCAVCDPTNSHYRRLPISVGTEVLFDKWAPELRTFGPRQDLLLLDFRDIFADLKR